MLQPVQLQDVAAHYAGEVAELRDFLVKAGMEVGTARSLGAVVLRLREDRAFRRDMTSHVWVVLHAGAEARYADLLGMLAVAAAGARFAAEASDADAQALLRFLMEAKASFDAEGAVPPRAVDRAGGAPVSVRQPLPAVEGWVRRDVAPSAERTLSLEMPEDALDRRRLVWAGVAACLLVVLCVGLGVSVWRHHHAEAAPVTAAAAAPAPAVVTPYVAAKKQDRVVALQPRVMGNRAVRGGSRVAPYSTVPESAADAGVGTRAKPSPGTPMSPVRSTPPATESYRALRVPRPATGTKPAVVAGGDARRTAMPGSLNTPVAPGRADALGAVRQATVRPTSLGIMAANVMYSPAPAYPVAASAARIQGEVKLEAEVDRDGNVASTRVISGPPLLSDAAADAVQRWRYRPYLYEGKPVAMNAMVVMDFQLP